MQRAPDGHTTSHIPLTPGAGAFRHPTYPLLALICLLLATMACVLISAPEELNDGKGTRERPVPARQYAKTLDYEVVALNVEWPQQDKQTSLSSETVDLRILLQIKCLKLADQVCQLDEIASHIKAVDGSGMLYDPVFAPDIETPLEGEVLGGATKAGWLVYQIPQGVQVRLALAEYGQDQRVFFQLP
jgi:hypothetical protein